MMMPIAVAPTARRKSPATTPATTRRFARRLCTDPPRWASRRSAFFMLARQPTSNMSPSTGTLPTIVSMAMLISIRNKVEWWCAEAGGSEHDVTRKCGAAQVADDWNETENRVGADADLRSGDCDGRIQHSRERANASDARIGGRQGHQCFVGGAGPCRGGMVGIVGIVISVYPAGTSNRARRSGDRMDGGYLINALYIRALAAALRVVTWVSMPRGNHRRLACAAFILSM